jgi:hypothetical protein
VEKSQIRSFDDALMAVNILTLQVTMQAKAYIMVRAT